MITMLKISPASFISDIVNNDYRTSEVFRKYGIEYYYSGQWSLDKVCQSNNLDLSAILKELELSMHTIHLPNTLQFEKWSVDFLIDYIINIHHAYLKKALPGTKEQLEKFEVSYRDIFPALTEVLLVVNDLVAEMLPHMQHEEEIIFPYIKQVAHAYNNREAYASLLVRTLRKPVETVMHHEHETVNKMLSQIKLLTHNYTPPENASTKHKVAYQKLKEIDDDLTQHIYLENNILFPKAIAMEKKLLET